MSLRLAIGGDHAAFRYKAGLLAWIEDELSGVTAIDCGAYDETSVDYPDLAARVATRVAGGEADLGVVLDAAGLGSAIAANKIHGIRCATCHDELTVTNSRRHNDANVLALGTRVVNAGYARTLIRIWISTPFDGGRHQRRVDKIMALESAR